MGLLTRSRLFSVAVVFIAGFTAMPAQAQSQGSTQIYDVEFKKDRFEDSGHVQVPRSCPPGAPQGVCGNSSSKRYSLTARAGERINIDIGSDSGSAIFTIFSPAGDALEGGSARRTWSGRLPVNGVYRINVYAIAGNASFNVSIKRQR